MIRIFSDGISLCATQRERMVMLSTLFSSRARR